MSQVSELGDQDEAVDEVVELARSPLPAKTPTTAAQNYDVDEVFLFDDCIPSIPTRVPTSAEPAETLEVRRRNRLLCLISDPRVYSLGLQRSASVHLDDRQRQRFHNDNLTAELSSSWTNSEHQPRGLTPSNAVDDDKSHDDTEVGGQRPDGREQNQPRGRRLQNRLLPTNGSGSARRKKMRSVDASCSGCSDAVTIKRRGKLAAGKMVVIEDPTCSDDVDDDRDAELSCHLCNGNG